MKKNLLITGGSGFLGVHLALELKKKFNVFLGSRNQKRNREASNLTKCKDIPLDVSNISSVRDAVNYCNPSIIIHAAATKFVDISEEFPFECSDVNILGSSNVARVAIERGVNTVIGISTDKASQPIKNFYGFSKATMEKLFLSANNNSISNFLCVRYGNVFSSRGSVVTVFKKLKEQKKPLEITDMNMTRFNITLDDNELYINSGNVSKHNGVTLDDTFTIKPVAANAIRLVKPEYKSNITRK